MRFNRYPFLLAPAGEGGAAAGAAATGAASGDGGAAAAAAASAGDNKAGAGDKGVAAQGAGDKGGVQQTQAQEWFNGLPDDLKSEPTLTRFRDKPFVDVVKFGLEARKAIGVDPSTIIRKPGADATPEQITAYHRSLGVPEKPEDYDIKSLNLPDSVKRAEDVEKPFLAVAHKFGMTPDAVKGVIEWFYDLGTTFEKDQRVKLEGVKASNTQLIREQWGGNADRRQAQINNFASSNDPEGKALAKLKAFGLDHDPDIVFMLDRMEKSGHNPGLVGGNTPVQLLTAAQAKERIATIRGDDKHPYNAGKEGSPEYENARKHMRELYVIAEGGA